MMKTYCTRCNRRVEAWSWSWCGVDVIYHSTTQKLDIYDEWRLLTSHIRLVLLARIRKLHHVIVFRTSFLFMLHLLVKNPILVLAHMSIRRSGPRNECRPRVHLLR
jgi:hypothetical protein